MSASRRSVLRLGTRGSALALAQTGWVAQRLRTAGLEVRVVPVRTAGDTYSEPITDIGVGVFVSALREALVAGEVDAAVHSYKDLPTAADPRLVLAAVPERADPRDALVARDRMVLGELPPGATSTRGSVGSSTGSSMVWWSRPLGWPGSAGSLKPPSCSTRSRCCRRPGRERWPASAGWTTWTPHARWPLCSTTLGCAPRSPPSGRCWPRWRPAAAPRSARSPMSSRTGATTDGWRCDCPCKGSQPLRVVAFSARPPWGSSPMPSSSAATLRPSCWTWVPARRVGQSASGSSARRDVPAPAGLSRVMVPPSASTRSFSPMRPEPRTGSAPPVPSSRTWR
jgi:porphobilinogen deaminase-like protein